MATSTLPSRLTTDLAADEPEQLVVLRDASVGLVAVVCIDSTVLGPADGGVRMLPYPALDDAVADVSALARAMTLKWAIAGEDRGGGKAVIVGDPRTDKTPALFERFGALVHSFGGSYWAGADVGITPDDLAHVHAATPYVSTLPERSGGSGDIGPATAAGVRHAMRACVGRALGEPTLRGRRVALQGLGSCGAAALDQLVAEGAEVIATDVDERRMAAAVDRHGIRTVEPDAIGDVAADVFAPFALGRVISERMADRLDVAVVAGSANNVMVDRAAEARLVARGVVYAVDVVANAGGAIADAHRITTGGHDRAALDTKLAAIGPRTLAVLDRAAADGVLPSVAAEQVAEERLARAHRERRGGS